MKTLNQVLIEGNLTRDAEARTVGDSVPLCSFSLAYNRSYRVKNEWKKETGYFDVALWGPEGKELARRLTKGAHVLVVGRLRYEQRADKEGRNRSRVTILANQVTLLGKSAEAPARQSRPASKPEARSADPARMTEYPRIRAELAALMNSGAFDAETVQTVLAEAQRIPPRDVAQLQGLLHEWQGRQRKAS